MVGYEECPVGNICEPQGPPDKSCVSRWDHLSPLLTVEEVCHSALVQQLERAEDPVLQAQVRTQGLIKLKVASAQLELAMSPEVPDSRVANLFDASEETLTALETDHDMRPGDWLTARQLAVYFPYFRQRRTGNETLPKDTNSLQQQLAQTIVFVETLPLAATMPQEARRQLMPRKMIAREHYLSRLTLSSLMVKHGYNWYPTTFREKSPSRTADGLSHDGYILDSDGKVPLRSTINGLPEAPAPEIVWLPFNTMVASGMGYRDENSSSNLFAGSAAVRKALIASICDQPSNARASSALDSVTNYVRAAVDSFYQQYSQESDSQPACASQTV
jgi:hypothetical protein